MAICTKGTLNWWENVVEDLLNWHPGGKKGETGLLLPLAGLPAYKSYGFLGIVKSVLLISWCSKSDGIATVVKEDTIRHYALSRILVGR